MQDEVQQGVVPNDVLLSPEPTSAKLVTILIASAESRRADLICSHSIRLAQANDHGKAANSTVDTAAKRLLDSARAYDLINAIRI